MAENALGAGGWVNSLRNYLKPEPGDTYGNILPLARDGETNALRLSLPMMARDAVNNLAFFADAPRAAYAGEIDPMDRATQQRLAQGVFEMGAGGMAARAVPTEDIARNAVRYYRDQDGAIKVWHGSPHDFDKFSMDNIGTGEGAQAYGHGLYFAENPDTAAFYRDNYAKPDGALFQTETARQMAQDQLQSWAGDVEGGINDLKSSLKNMETTAKFFGADEADTARINDLKDAISYMEKGAPRGSLYEVNIDANPEDFLDWDKPLSEQTGPVKEYIDNMRDLGAEVPSDTATGADLYRWMANEKSRKNGLGFGPEQGPTTQRLAKEKIPGIRYADQGSRGTDGGTSNYVVFDDSLLSILSKNGNALNQMVKK